MKRLSLNCRRQSGYDGEVTDLGSAIQEWELPILHRDSEYDEQLSGGHRSATLIENIHAS